MGESRAGAVGSHPAAVVFLHGSGGPFAFECWLASRGAADAGLPTVCPSTGRAGEWWTPDGRRTVELTLDWVAGQGVQRVYLAGLSNGGFGLSRIAGDVIASRNAAQRAPTVQGLVALSGVTTDLPASLPGFVFHGRHDAMAAFGPAAQVGRRGATELVAVDGGHFVAMSKRDLLRAELARWLRQQEARG